MRKHKLLCAFLGTINFRKSAWVGLGRTDALISHSQRVCLTAGLVKTHIRGRFEARYQVTYGHEYRTSWPVEENLKPSANISKLWSASFPTTYNQITIQFSQVSLQLSLLSQNDYDYLISNRFSLLLPFSAQTGIRRTEWHTYRSRDSLTAVWLAQRGRNLLRAAR